MANIKTQQFLGGLTLAALMLGLAACGSSSSPNARIARCPKNYDPVSVTPPSGNKQMPLKRGQALPLPVDGNYAHVSTDIYYHEIENDVIVHISETQDKNGAFSANLVCLSGLGFNVDMQTVRESIKFVSDILVAPTGETSVRHRTLNFRIGRPEAGSPLWLVGPTVPEKDIDKTWVPGSPTDEFSDFADSAQFINDLNTTPDTKDYQLLAVMHKPVTVNATKAQGTAEVKIRVVLKGITTVDRQKRDASPVTPVHPRPSKI